MAYLVRTIVSCLAMAHQVDHLLIQTGCQDGGGSFCNFLTCNFTYMLGVQHDVVNAGGILFRMF